MKIVRTIILRTAGTNCDKETAYAFKRAGSEPDLIHVNVLGQNKNLLLKYHILAIPGGFTYGDDIASGKILANEMRFKLQKVLVRFISEGRLIIGICNGFQVLVKMGLLPNISVQRTAYSVQSGGEPFKIEATLSLNDSGKFEDRWIHLKTINSEQCVWTKDLPEIIYLPVAHGEGKFIPKDNTILAALQKNGQIVFRYVTAQGERGAYPINPNGSIDDIAGVCDPTGRILGMMPHPERHMSFLQHPNWRRMRPNDAGMGVGLKIFKNGINFVKNNL